jgi:acyl carrier protein
LGQKQCAATGGKARPRRTSEAAIRGHFGITLATEARPLHRSCRADRNYVRPWCLGAVRIRAAPGVLKEHVVELEAIKPKIRNRILDEFLPGETAESLTPDIRLISEGIIDSMASLKLVAYLEEDFSIQVPAHFIDAEHLDTVDLIAETVMACKQAA